MMDIRETIEVYLSIMEMEEILMEAHDKLCGAGAYVAPNDQIILNSEGVLGLVDELIMRIGQHVVLRPDLLTLLLEESLPLES